MQIEDHYALLLGVKTPWEISSVDLNMAGNRVDIEIEYTDTTGVCPECGAACSKHDDRERRTWRHLDTMQFSTYLHAQLPRIKCPCHGVKTVTAPWATKNSRFTLLFESFAIRVIQASRSIEEARKLLKLNWHQVEAIKRRAVERGLARRDSMAIEYLGIDEKQFRSGHRYITNLVDLKQGRVLDVVEDRKEDACKALLLQALTKEQREEVTAVALETTHQMMYLGENANWTTTVTWWGRLEPVKKVARMLKAHEEGLLNYFDHRFSNAVAEGLNSRIQTVKSNARGYRSISDLRSFEGFRTSILFYCGKLDMLP